MTTLIILRGLPASGKSTIAQKYVEQGFVKICFDDIHQELFGEYRFNQFGKVLAEAYKRFANAVEERKDIIIDNTNMREKNVQEWINKVRLHEREFLFLPDEIYIVEVKYIHATIAECIKRNRLRDRGNMNVPDSVILQMAARSDIPEVSKEYNKFATVLLDYFAKDEETLEEVLSAISII